MERKAFISVSDKTGVVEFARGLVELGFRILSTGGTQRALSQAGIDVTGVSEITDFPECLDGRVKTLHPKIHAGILAVRGNAEHMRQLAELGVETIDLVAVNLYPFKETISRPDVPLEEAIENIDIGGPTMLRAAAKNWQDIIVISDVGDYDGVLADLREHGEVPAEKKFILASKVFENTAAYDALIARHLREKSTLAGLPEKFTVTFEKQQEMRYGENPHQNAAFYKDPLPVPGCLANAVQLNGKELSFNNINDAAGALDALREFKETTVVAVKHANPCGVGSGANVREAVAQAYACDPVSIFGGIVAATAEIDGETAAEMSRIFLEIVIAPSYTAEALEILKQKKNLRVLQLEDICAPPQAGAYDAKKVQGGLLVQEVNDKLLDGVPKTVTKRAPTDEEMKTMEFAFKVVKHIKSNGIVVAKDMATLGIGPGQVNRIWVAQMAIERSGDGARGAVMASDAFFPFDDCVEEAAKAGITAIIQPGGSVRDGDSIKKCDAYGIAMVFTGIRHFKH
jgi:phosphoribosylaminoimidazolecarboxamide formyltransferase/IMP cyclohydrolase